jgi:hypothetical protein
MFAVSKRKAVLLPYQIASMLHLNCVLFVIRSRRKSQCSYEVYLYMYIVHKEGLCHSSEDINRQRYCVQLVVCQYNYDIN